MAAWLLWLVVAGVLLIIETLSLSLVFAMVAGGALVGALAAGFGGPIALQVAAFGVASIGLLIGVRPIAKKHMIGTTTHRMGIESLIGQDAIVVQNVDAVQGRVNIGGAVWSATSYDEDETLEVGAKVRVMEIRGATAIVWGGV